MVDMERKTVTPSEMSCARISNRKQKDEEKPASTLHYFGESRSATRSLKSIIIMDVFGKFPRD